MIVLAALGVAVALVGLVAIGDEWRLSRTRPQEGRGGTRLETVALGSIAVGAGVALSYVGFSG